MKHLPENCYELHVRQIQCLGCSNTRMKCMVSLTHNGTFYLELKSRAIDTFQQQWYVNVETSYSLNLYTYFKTCFEQEQYLNELLPKYRVALSKLRLASNKLNIITG